MTDELLPEDPEGRPWYERISFPDPPAVPWYRRIGPPNFSEVAAFLGVLLGGGVLLGLLVIGVRFARAGVPVAEALAVVPRESFIFTGLTAVLYPALFMSASLLLGSFFGRSGEDGTESPPSWRFLAIFGVVLAVSPISWAVPAALFGLVAALRFSLGSRPLGVAAAVTFLSALPLGFALDVDTKHPLRAAQVQLADGSELRGDYIATNDGAVYVSPGPRVMVATPLREVRRVTLTERPFERPKHWTPFGLYPLVFFGVDRRSIEFDFHYEDVAPSSP